MRLAAIDAPELVVTEIARSLEIQEQRDVDEALLDYLADRELLLLLDNFEHLTGAAPFVSDLVERSDRLVVLGTSRSPLHLSHERVVVVDPLDEDAAVELFVERARTADSRFRLDPADEPVLRELCGRLDGLPLAIEIAAARAGLLTVHDLASQMQVWLGAAAAHDLPERQRTLAATLAWSYAILSPEHRSLHARLAVFQGRFTPPAAYVGFGASIEDLEDARVGGAATTGRQRPAHGGLVTLRTVRELALERLDPAEFGRARGERDRGLDDLVERASEELSGSDPAGLADRAGVVAARPPRLARGCEAGGRPRADHPHGLVAGTVLARPSPRRRGQTGARGSVGGRASRGRASARSRALDTSPAWQRRRERPGGRGPPEGGARALQGARGAEREISFALTELAWMSLDTGELDLAERQASEALENARAARDERAASSALNALAFLATERAEPARARTLALESLEIRRRIGDRLLIADAGAHGRHGGPRGRRLSTMPNTPSASASSWPARSATPSIRVGRSAASARRPCSGASRKALARCCSRRSASSPNSATRRSRPSASSHSRSPRTGSGGAQLLGAALAARERAGVTAVAVERQLETEARERFERFPDAIREGRRLSVVEAALAAGVEPALV